MKTDCDIIRDLLPLYVEQVASPASRALVEQHLAECPACAALRDQMQAPVPVKAEPNTAAPLKKIKQSFGRLRIALAACLVLLCAIVVCFGLYHYETPVTLEQAQLTVTTETMSLSQMDSFIAENFGDGVRSVRVRVLAPKNDQGEQTFFCYVVQGERVRLKMYDDLINQEAVRITRFRAWAEPILKRLLPRSLWSSGEGTPAQCVLLSENQWFVLHCSDQTAYYYNGFQNGVQRAELDRRGR